MAPAPSDASTSASTIHWSSDWQEAKHEEGSGSGHVELVLLTACTEEASTISTSVSARQSQSQESDKAESNGRIPAAEATGSASESSRAGVPARAAAAAAAGGDGAAAWPRDGAVFADDYDLLDCVLGTGASGSVREAICKKSGRRVAVKSFDVKELLPKSLANLKREVEVHAAIDHPGVVRIEAVYESEDSVTIVLERLEGGELFDRLLERGRFSEEQAAKVAVQLLRAVAYLHSHSMMHRDIKPENIMYSEQDADDIKLIDFGFATYFDRRAGAPKLAQRCGTLQYVAPEVLTGLGYGEKADLWSLGSVCYTLLTMKAMYSGEDADIKRKNTMGAVDFSRTFKAASPEAQDFVRALLRVEPAARPGALEALRHPWLHARAGEEAAAALTEAMAEAAKARAQGRARAPAPVQLRRLAARLEAMTGGAAGKASSAARGTPWSPRSAAAAAATGDSEASKERTGRSSTNCFSGVRLLARRGGHRESPPGAWLPGLAFAALRSRLASFFCPSLQNFALACK